MKNNLINSLTMGEQKGRRHHHSDSRQRAAAKGKTKKMERVKQFYNKNQFIIENKNTDVYLEEIDELLTKLRQKFLEMAKMFYPKKKSGLLIENNIGENQLRFNIEAKIEDDSSDGVNEVPAVVLEPIAVNKSNMDEVIISSGYHLREDVYLNVSRY